ncbi:unnamed protein product [Leptidea sinapis]|uniref:Phosphoglucomutase-2 n=1 Tax=Leptidea sinapis TaxID=189913 RepID=A0A5E4PRX9_9NEOP|nr:unnamed protein product [Leptidea sinapis]
MSVCKSGDSELDAAVERWLKYDKNPITKQEVLDDIHNSQWRKLRKTMLKRQKFGTAGLRGRMGAGFSCMNDVVVLQTAQGLCSYLKRVCEPHKLDNGIIVGFDGRYNSKRFAELTAKVFTSASIPVCLFSSVCPTPLVSFTTIVLDAAAGVMVTASHNPKEDNGYKVYWGNGSQIITPHDDNILEEILNCLDIPDKHWDIDDIRSNALVTDKLEDMTSQYMQYIRDSLHDDVLVENRRQALSTVYSAMHGVGYEYVLKAFEAANLKAPLSVIEQQDPNPDFPTVKFPNPEERECLELSKRLADQNGVQLIVVNDPDADRLAVAEYNKREKSWKVFSGNEMGSLLGWWILKQQKREESTRELYLLASFVSSHMLRAIAGDSATFLETLTGFKWMGNKTLLLKEEGKKAIFAYEEAIGYMCSPVVPDKDGVSAAVQVVSMASHLHAEGTTLQDQLHCLYRQFGYHVSFNSYFIVEDPAVVAKIFYKIRNHGSTHSYPKYVGSCEIGSINDFTAGVRIPDDERDNSKSDAVGTGLDQKYTSGEMISFRCHNGLRVIIRTSGTEPKLKYYTELVCDAPTRSEQEAKKLELEAMVKEFINELIQPQLYSLVF